MTLYTGNHNETIKHIEYMLKKINDLLKDDATKPVVLSQIYKKWGIR